MKYTTEFNDPSLVFDQGVAAIDLITLAEAGKTIDPLMQSLWSQSCVLPEPTKDHKATSFEDLMQIKIDDSNPNEIGVTATIDTKQMVWDKGYDPKKATLIDYSGFKRQAVSFTNVQVSQAGDTFLARVPLTLEGNRPALMWFAQMSLDELQKTGLYKLFEQVELLTEGFSPDATEQYDEILIPSQQIDYTRAMTEVMQINTMLNEVKQKLKVALDDTGARVFVETEMVLGASFSEPTEPKIAIFGKQGPVVFWLTEPDNGNNLTPFAVVATTSEAWLNPDEAVNFDFETTETKSIKIDISPVANLDDAQKRAYQYYDLDKEEDKALRSLFKLTVKKVFSDGWVFLLEPVGQGSEPTIPADFLLVGKDGSTSGIMPDGKASIDQSSSIAEARGLWEKQLYNEAMKKHNT